VTSVLLVPDEPDQAPRLAAFRAEHPAVTVQPGQFQTWEARIIEPDGETVVVRHTLRELLDRLGALLGGVVRTLPAPPTTSYGIWSGTAASAGLAGTGPGLFRRSASVCR